MKFKGENAYVLQIACVDHDEEEETVLPDAPDDVVQFLVNVSFEATKAKRKRGNK